MRPTMPAGEQDSRTPLLGGSWSRPRAGPRGWGPRRESPWAPPRESPRCPQGAARRSLVLPRSCLRPACSGPRRRRVSAAAAGGRRFGGLGYQNSAHSASPPSSPAAFSAHSQGFGGDEALVWVLGHRAAHHDVVLDRHVRARARARRAAGRSCAPTRTERPSPALKGPSP